MHVRTHLGALQVPVDDLVVVEVLLSGRNLLGPVDQSHGRYFVDTLAEEVEERSVWTELHDDAVARRLGANAAKLREIKNYSHRLCYVRLSKVSYLTFQP